MPSRILPPDLPPATVDQGEFVYNTFIACFTDSEIPPLQWQELPSSAKNAWTATAQAILDARGDVWFVARMVDHE